MARIKNHLSRMAGFLEREPLFSLSESRRQLISNSRQPYPSYPQRFPVPDEYVNWSVEYPEYAPSDYTNPRILQNSGSSADPVDPTSIDWESRPSFETPLQFEPVHGRPLNPRGRTGLAGRGRLYKWGPNIAVDPVVTRINEAGELQVVAITRSDTGVLALPGGFLDADESPLMALRREFTEEAGGFRPDSPEFNTFQQLVRIIFTNSNVRLLYHGYVDDFRCTDHAWIETIAAGFHCTCELEGTEIPPRNYGLHLPLHAGDDARAVKWVTIQSEEFQQHFYQPHRDYVTAMARSLASSL